MMATLLTITILNLEISGPSKKTDRARHWGPDTTDIAIISCILDKLLSADSGSSRCMIHCKPALSDAEALTQSTSHQKDHGKHLLDSAQLQ